MLIVLRKGFIQPKHRTLPGRAAAHFRVLPTSCDGTTSQPANQPTQLPINTVECKGCPCFTSVSWRRIEIVIAVVWVDAGRTLHVLSFKFGFFKKPFYLLFLRDWGLALLKPRLTLSLWQFSCLILPSVEIACIFSYAQHKHFSLNLS